MFKKVINRSITFESTERITDSAIEFVMLYNIKDNGFHMPYKRESIIYMVISTNFIINRIL